MEVAAGDRGHDASELPRLVVPPTPSGVAMGLTHLSKAAPVRRPGCYDPTGIRRFPRVELDDEIAVPEFLRTTPETAIECRVPGRLDALYVIAPLVTYLGADVRIERRESPAIVVPDRDVELELPELPALQDTVADLLRRIVSLDRLVHDRNADELLEAADVDPAWARRAPPHERLAGYLEADFEAIEREPPNWDLAMYVEPTVERFPTLAHILERPCPIYLPEATPVDREELIGRSLEDFYRSASPPELDVDVVSPTRTRGRVRGWLADGVALDAFKATPTAYENRRARRDRTGEGRVTVVFNDTDMEPERVAVDRIYRDLDDDLDASIERRVTCDELAAVFERPTSFVHYIGHCDEAGLRCADGNLPITDIETSRTRTFLLNACGSYREGRSLVRKGSIAGAVTLNPVVDGQAAKVGIAFARLVTSGFCIERALRIARRRAIMNKDYVAVGDGTYALSRHASPEVSIEPREGTHFGVTLGAPERLELTLTRTEVLDYLRRSEAPVEYAGERRPPDRVYERLVGRPRVS